MRADLREKLAVVWGKQEKTGVTPVTGVTRGTSGGITHATENVTVVTATDADSDSDAAAQTATLET